MGSGCLDIDLCGLGVGCTLWWYWEMASERGEVLWVGSSEYFVSAQIRGKS